MARAKTYQARFTAGIFGKRLHAAEDLERFTIGAKDILNGICQAQGGVLKRGGSQDLSRSQSDAYVSRLWPFVSGMGARYMLEFCDQLIRVLSPDGQVIDEIGAEWLTVDTLPGLRFHGAGDILWITTRSHDFYLELRHFGPASWTIQPTPFSAGPFLSENGDGDHTLTASATTGQGVALASSKPIFQAGHVGALFRLRHPSGAMPGDQWEPEADYSGAAQVRNAQKFYEKISPGNLESGRGAPTHEDGTWSDGKIDWVYLHDGAGIVRITAVADATNATCDVLERLPSSDATKYWSEGAFSDAQGFPYGGVVFDERNFLGGTRLKPDTVDGTRFGTIHDHRAETGLREVLATHAIRATPGTKTVAPGRWLAAMQRLLLGTTRGVFSLQGTTETQALAPGEARLRPVSRWGCADVEPEIVGEALFYVQSDGRTLREVGLADDSAAFAVGDASLIADDLMSPGLTRLAFQDGRDPVLWVLRADGQLLGLSIERNEKVRAWHRHVLGGRLEDGPPVIEDIAVLPAGQDGQDELWLLTRRTVAGIPRRRIEALHAPFYGETTRQDRAWVVDAAIRYDGWNADPARTLTVNNAGGEWRADDPVTITASEALFGAGPGAIGVGRRLGFGRGSIPQRQGDVWAPLTLEITAVSSPTAAAGRLRQDWPAGRYRGAATAEWGVAATVLTGLEHLENGDVAVTADGGDGGRYRVTGDQITLSAPAFIATVGYPYDFVVETLNLSPGAGALRGQANRAPKAWVRVLDSLGGAVAAGANKPTPLEPRIGSELYGWPPALRTKGFQAQLNGDSDDELSIRVTQAAPLPFCLLAIKTDIAADD